MCQNLIRIYVISVSAHVGVMGLRRSGEFDQEDQWSPQNSELQRTKERVGVVGQVSGTFENNCRFLL